MTFLEPADDHLDPGPQVNQLGWMPYRCDACEVRWAGRTQCWVCGEEGKSILGLVAAKR